MNMRKGQQTPGGGYSWINVQSSWRCSVFEGVLPQLPQGLFHRVEGILSTGQDAEFNYLVKGFGAGFSTKMDDFQKLSWEDFPDVIGSGSGSSLIHAQNGGRPNVSTVGTRRVRTVLEIRQAPQG